LGPPKTRNPATGNGRVNRKSQALSGTEAPQYPPGKSNASLSVYAGRLHVGWICEVDGQHQAYAPDGAPLGTFPTRTAAARAFSGVRS
jgi:hypothetical protein